MCEKIKIKIDNEFKDDFEKLHQLLVMLNIDCKIEYVERESMSGIIFEDEYLMIDYDMNEVFRKLHRSLGRPKKSVSRIMSVKEIREMMEEKNANEVAKKLGISKRTLFRRLADTHTVSSSLITNSLLPHSNNLLHDIYFFYISQLLY